MKRQLTNEDLYNLNLCYLTADLLNDKLNAIRKGILVEEEKQLFNHAVRTSKELSKRVMNSFRGDNQDTIFLFDEDKGKLNMMLKLELICASCPEADAEFMKIFTAFVEKYKLDIFLKNNYK